ncbi:MAG: type II CRISPR RNA-guided endonuclease Cas9 [Saprospiraceae bacterium]|nr:hypothetical protein [Candidatus Vicinibacter proximus]
MRKILGLDLGTNSLGWALVEEGQRMIDGGVIIFPKGTNQDLKTGKESSRAQERTTYRSARRRNYRKKMRILRVRSMLQEAWKSEIYNATEHSTSPLDLYKLRYEGLNRVLNSVELSRVILYMAKKRGFKSTRSMEIREDSKQSESGRVKKGIAELNKLMEDGGYITLGHFYFDLIKDHVQGKRLNERILERWTSRSMYEQELHKILDTQINLANELINPELKSKVLSEVFYQRKLKSCKHLVGKCRFENNKRCMPRSHPLFQEFRFWTAVNNLTWTDYDTGEYSTISLDQKKILAELFESRKGITEAQIKKTLGLSKRVEFNEIELKPMTTILRLKESLEDRYEKLSNDQILSIYHSLLYTDDDHFPLFKQYLSNKFLLSDEIISNLWDMPLESDYSNISHKAASKILPFLKNGLQFDKACGEAGYQHTISKPLELSDLVPHPKTNELKNPVVQKSTNICISLVNDVIKKYGKPDEVRIELLRELKKPKSERELIFTRNNNVKKKREKYVEVLSKALGYEIAHSDGMLKKYELWLELGCDAEDLQGFNGFAGSIKTSDLEKYQLWLEADRISPYSGKVISLERLMSSDIEVEHIMPFSRSLNDSFMNKTLCERSLNLEKLNKTPIEYFSQKSNQELDEFKKRISIFSNAKKREIFLAEALPDDFSNSQLSDTAYIATLVVDKIQQSIPKVSTTKGGTTAHLRKAWGLNGLLYADMDAEMVVFSKNRGDHRHHFIDAAVIASTSVSHTQKLARATIGGDGRIHAEGIDAPWNSFRADLEDKLKSCLVVHNFSKRLTSKSINKYRYSRKKPTDQKQILAIRGSMHEDTLYGKIYSTETKQEYYVVRKEIKSMEVKQLDKIVDRGVREYLKNLASTVSGGWSEVIKSPILYNGRPLRRVRTINNSKSLPLLRDETKTYIEPGNNYVLAIYEDPVNGKRDYESVTFYEGVQRKLNGENIYPASKNGKKLLYTVSAFDKFIVYKDHPDEIDWTNEEDLNHRLYHVIKFTGNSIYLGKSIFGNIKADYDKPPIKYILSTNTLKAVKVKLDRCGHINWRSGEGME